METKNYYETIPKNAREVLNILSEHYSKEDLKNLGFHQNFLAAFNGVFMIENGDGLSIEFLSDTRFRAFDYETDVPELTTVCVARVTAPIFLKFNKYLYDSFSTNLITFDIDISADIAPNKIIETALERIQDILKIENFDFGIEVNHRKKRRIKK